MKQNIALCGFMGSGKTTVGTYLANCIHFRYIDTDSLIEQKYNLKINKIFKEHGEKFFRDAEHDVIKGFCYLNPSVISLGGGAIIYPRNFKIIKQFCDIVFISTSLDTVISRIAHDDSRPLLGTNYAKIKQLYYKRLPIYNEVCDFSVNGDNTPETIVCEILNKMEKKYEY